MQMNMDLNLLNNIIGNINIESLSNKINIIETVDIELVSNEVNTSFESLILNCLDNKSNNLEEKTLIDKDDIIISEEEINKILSLLNKIIVNNEDSLDTKDSALNGIVEKLNKSNNIDEKINLINQLIKNIDDVDHDFLSNKTYTFSHTVEELKDELNKIISSYSQNEKESPNQNESLNEIDIVHRSKFILEVKKDTSNKELDILNEIASKNDYEKINFNINNKILDSTTTKTHSIEQQSYKNIESNISYDAIKSIKYMDLNNIKELTVNLRPKELGQMNITLLKENSDIKAIITVHSKEVLDLVNKNIADIKGQLENANINIKDVVVNMKTEDNYVNEGFERNFSHSQNEQENSNKNNKRSPIIEDKEEKEIIEEENINLLV